MKNNSFIITLLVLLAPCSYSQNKSQQKIDSLLAILAKSKEDTNKVQVYNNLMSLYVYYKPQEGLSYGQTAIKLAEKLNWTFGIAKIKNRAGRIYWRLGDYDKALECHFEAQRLYLQEGRKLEAANLLVEIAQDYLDGSKYAEAKTWLFKAIHEGESMNDKGIVADAYDKLTYLYDMQGNFIEATKTSYAYLKINEEMGNKNGMAHANYMLGENAYEMGNNADAIKFYKQGLQLVTDWGDKIAQAAFNHFIGDIHLANKNFAEAMKHYAAALTLAEETGDIFSVAAMRQGMGNGYRGEEKYTEALSSYLVAEAKFKQVANKQDLAGLYAGMGITYIHLGNYQQAKKTFDQAGLLYDDIGSKQLSMIDYYDGRRQLDSATGNWKNAYENYRQFVSLKDSSFNKETLKKLVASQMQFDTDKKDAATKVAQEKKDLITNGELKRQRNIKNSAFAVAALVLLFSAVLYLQRNKLAKEKKRSDLLLQDKELLLREIHHRVKNNLEVVSSLLALQSAQIEDQNTKDAMQEGQNRVQSIGIVHQKLYQGTNLGAIEMKDYFIDLGESILDSFGAEKRVTIECAMSRLDVDIDTAVPLGLIVNELLTNTLKYAFPAGQHGKVLIKLEKRPNGILQLQISDDGVGKSGVTHGTGFGGQLVGLLTQQLGGSMREEIKDGTHIYFEFKPGKAA